MKIEQIYTGCLAHGAYYIESNGEAAIIDPLRETGPYLERARKDKAQIKYVFETHFHADFVSGHIDLSRKTDATIVYGPTARPGFTAHVAEDGEQFNIGSITITAIHTPGHTMESTCYLLKDEAGKPIALFSGDTLFIGDVGRPDLAQKVVKELTQERLAAMLYDSLQKLSTLPDDVIIFPAHGAGSACGKNMSRETTDTLGHQKAVNYALQPMDKSVFIEKVLDGLTPPPAYFPENVMMNINGYESIDTVMERGLQALSPDAFEAAANETGAILLDTRDPQVFAEEFIPNSINIGINGSFAPWVGALIPDIQQPILIIADENKEEEVITRLARVGYDHAIGFLKGGFNAWKGRETETISSITVAQLAKLENPAILDVRRNSEYASQHVIGAENIPLDYINQHISAIRKDQTYYVHCVSGYRSMIFTSIMRARGYTNLVNVTGGFRSIKESGLLPLSAYVCPTTML